MTDRTTAQSGAEGRTRIKTWLRENGVRGAFVDALSMPELNSVWTDKTDETLERYRMQAEAAPVLPRQQQRPQAGGDAASLMAEAIRLMAQSQSAPLDESRVVELIREHARPTVEVREIVVSATERKEVQGRTHYLFPLVVKALAARVHVWLVGPAGSGKTTLAGQAAEALGLSHVALSVCGQTTKTDLLGYMDAHGVYRGTCFRTQYEHGGVFCLDEVDNGNANVLAVLNSALANGEMTFPDATVKRHADFVVVACANTFGNGATGGYVGRNQVDAATLDRFFFVEMPYDIGLEAHIMGVQMESPKWDENGSQTTTVAEWLQTVWNARKAVEANGIKAVISPRASYMGAALIKQGVPLLWLRRGLLRKGMSVDTIAKINA